MGHPVAKAPTVASATGNKLSPMASASPRTEHGFSLFELMVVMMLVVLLFTVAGVSVSRSISGAELRNTAREITAAMRHTRGQAVIQREEQVFLVDGDQKTWQAAGRPAKTLPEELEIKLITARQELTGDNAGGIRFYPDGASTGGRVVLASDGREWHITVGWLTGEISRERGSEQ